MPVKKPKTKFIDLDSDRRDYQVYRVTFKIDVIEYAYLIQEIQGVGEVLKEEMEVINND